MGIGKGKAVSPFIQTDIDGFPKEIDRRYGFIREFKAGGGAAPTVSWLTNGSGTYSANAAPGAGEDVAGLDYILSSSVSAGAHKSIYSTFNNFPIYNGVVWFEAYARLLTLDTTSTEESRIFLGLADNVASNSAYPTDGVYFMYDSQNNGDFWSVSLAKAGSATEYVADGAGGRTTAAVTAGVDTFARFTFKVDAANETVSFWINGSLVADETDIAVTNMPDTISNLAGPGLLVQKLVGTSNQALYFDYIKMAYIYNTPRS